MIKYIILCLLALLMGAPCTRIILAAENMSARLYVRTNGRDSGWQCDSVLHACLTGGREGIAVKVAGITTPVYPNLHPGWPREITIEASQTTGNVFASDPEILRRLDITRVIEWRDYEEDSASQRKADTSATQAEHDIGYFFGFTVPEEYAGQRLYLRVTWSSPGIGPLTSVFYIDPLNPCNEKARQRAQGTYVEEAFVQGLHQRAVRIADSLVVLGWRDPRGLGWATISAQNTNQPKKALSFLDLNYETNGQVQPIRFGDEARLYSRMRQALMDSIRDHDQQQQH